MAYRQFRNTLILIVAVMTIAISLVTLLAWIALHPIHLPNGFNRRIIKKELTLLHVSENSSNVNGVSGASQYRYYFRTIDPARIWSTDHSLQNSKLIQLRVPNSERIASAFYSVVDSPVVHIMAGNGPAIIQAHLAGYEPFISRFPTALFTRAVKISTNTYVFRGFDTTEKKAGQLFIKGNPKSGDIMRRKNITGNTIDAAGISTDGQLSYDASTGLLLYVSFYSNQVFCLDTNLQLLYAGRTIDTVSRPQVEIGSAGNTVTASSPARVINSRSKVAEGRLYVVSKLKADNEDIEDFRNNAIIDTYDTPTGNYMGSFYLPYYKREKFTDFSVVRDKLVVVYKTHVAVYQLPAIRP